MLKYFRKELLYGLIITMPLINFGFCIVFSSPTVPLFRDEWRAPSIQTTIFNAILSLAAVVGPFVANGLLKFFNQKVCYFILQIFACLFFLLMLLANSKKFYVMIILRALEGVIMGATSTICPTMLIEVSPKGMTGFLGNLGQLGRCIGTLVLYLVGNWTVNLKRERRHLQALILMCGIFNFISSLLIWFVPNNFRGSDNSSEETNEEIDNQDNNKDAEEKESILEKKYLGKLAVGILLMIIQQFSGINAISTNLDDDFRDAGVPLDSGICAAITVAFQILAVFLTSFLVDKVGRKPLFTISCVGCGATLFIFSMNYQYKWSNWISLICICLYMFFFGVALGPVPWYIIPELFPPSLRSIGNSIICIVNQLFAFIVIFLFPIMRGNKDESTGKYVGGIGFMPSLVIFAVIGLLGGIFGFFFITEPNAENSVEDKSADTAEKP